MQDLHELPKLRDSLSYLYVEHAILDKKQQAIEYVQQDGRTLIPIANLSVLMLGPGTSITHAAINTLARSGCTVLWTGEDATRFYAQGTGETRKGRRLLRQAELVSQPQMRQQVVINMYRHRFNYELPTTLNLNQIRGKEGVRVREAYAQASRDYGVPWHGRKYNRGSWGSTDPINRALSAANALLNGLCHAAIVSGGYSPGLGFIHTGKQLSFVYDVADLYKADITIPIAFAAVAESEEKVESRVRAACREKFKETKLLQRILPDIDDLLDLQETADTPTIEVDGDVDADPALPTEYWHRIEGKKGGQDGHHDT
ncbi:MAG: subtype I-E CRISPR-associated endonuclease Cas1 [Anaerolineaceae bacterium]|nr:subtype I-E CRISPR-associated endonuclease Cas1 [Anaerolineaceae bacterium]